MSVLIINVERSLNRDFNFVLFFSLELQPKSLKYFLFSLNGCEVESLT